LYQEKRTPANKQRPRGQTIHEKKSVSGKPLTGARVLELLLDPCLVLFTLYISAFIYAAEFGSHYLTLSIIAFLTSYIVFKEMSVCRSWQTGGIKAQARDTIIAWLLVLVGLIFLAYFTKTSHLFSRNVMLTWAVITPLVLMFGHWFTRTYIFKIFYSERTSRKAIIVGTNEGGIRLAHEFATDVRVNTVLHGFFDDRKTIDWDQKQNKPYLGKLSEVAEYVKEHGIGVIYITLPMMQEQRILDLLDDLRDTTASIYFSPDLFLYDLIQGRIDDVNGLPVVAVCETPFYGINAFLKRISDIVASFSILILISPVLIGLALAVKLTSPGPVIFCQRRYGLEGEEFTVYKFRSMTVCDDGVFVKQASENDARVTKIGVYLRRYSLDELPQFINVLQGRMSIVGPRPHAVAHNEEYRKLIKGYMVRHKVRPGITGWAQVNGCRGETAEVDAMAARIDYDLDYLRNWSLWFDTKIIVKTVWVVLIAKNVY